MYSFFQTYKKIAPGHEKELTLQIPVRIFQKNQNTKKLLKSYKAKCTKAGRFAPPPPHHPPSLIRVKV